MGERLFERKCKVLILLYLDCFYEFCIEITYFFLNVLGKYLFRIEFCFGKGEFCIFSSENCEFLSK